MDCVAPPSKEGDAIHQCPRAAESRKEGFPLFDRPGSTVKKTDAVALGIGLVLNRWRRTQRQCVWWRYSVQAKGMTAITAPAQQLRHPKRQHKQPIRANRVRECGFVGLLAVDCIARKGTNTSTRQWPTKLHATCLRLVGTEYSASTTNPVPSTPTRFKQCFHVGPSFHVFWRWKEREKAGEEGRKGGGEGRGRRRRGMS